MNTGASVRKLTVDSRMCHGAWRGSWLDAMALVLATVVLCRGRGRGEVEDDGKRNWRRRQHRKGGPL